MYSTTIITGLPMEIRGWKSRQLGKLMRKYLLGYKRVLSNVHTGDRRSRPASYFWWPLPRVGWCWGCQTVPWWTLRVKSLASDAPYSRLLGFWWPRRCPAFRGCANDRCRPPQIPLWEQLLDMKTCHAPGWLELILKPWKISRLRDTLAKHEQRKSSFGLSELQRYCHLTHSSKFAPKKELWVANIPQQMALCSQERKKKVD